VSHLFRDLWRSSYKVGGTTQFSSVALRQKWAPHI